MRYKLAVAFVLLIAILALIATLQYATLPKPASPGRSDTEKENRRKAAWQSDRERDVLAPGESRTLATRNLLPFGTQSLLKVPALMRHGDFLWNERDIAAGEVNIWVDLRRQTISAFRNGHEIGTALIIYGAEDKTSPEGAFHVIRKVRNYHSRAYDAPMPSSLFITNDGVALHGSPMSARRASHGCIGLPVEFAEKLFAAADLGDVVIITSSTGSIDPYALK